MLFPQHFDAALAIQYARQPEKIANRIYANQMENGDEKSGDGWNYRGRGLLMTYGRENYKALSDFLAVDLVQQPSLVADKYFFDAAVFYFHIHKIWPMASAVSTQSIKKVRKAINGSTIGLEEVAPLVHKYYDLLHN